MKKLISITLIILFVLIGLYSYYIEPDMLKVSHYSIKDSELKGLKIVFPSDFHVKPNQKERLEEVVKVINNENPDIVLSAGDYISGHLIDKKSTMSIENIAKELGKIKSKYGIYTSLGNHDIWYSKDKIIDALEKNGIKVLSNSNTCVEIDGKKLYIAGVADESTENVDFEAALDGTSNPVILLSHSPDVFPDVPERVNLTLAGHTHGGQIVIPILGPIYTGSKYYDKYYTGLIDKDNKKMIVTRGIGVSILPFRFNCPPEIVVIEFE